jgi:hypothetical protein
MSDLFDGLRRYEEEFNKRAQRGLAKAGMRCLRDCVMDMPTAPVDEGTLRGSGFVFVGNRLIGTSKDQAGPKAKPTPATELSDVIIHNNLTATIGFNTPYAAYQHEGHRADGSHPVTQYKEPSAGPKFLENKLNGNRDDYMAIVAAEIRGSGGTVA